ncbi:MAG: bifunctional phosphopantothenoylcysteine decarboxylase/phosphopantothenate--cysteine ligase CoaBC, partial [Acidimicrobiales bacterium]
MSDRKPRIVLGVGGGIAAYKACEVLRGLTESGHDVRVVPTEAALNFVGAATFEALSGNPVHTGVFTEVPEVQHVRIGKEADLVLVVPATANLLAKAAHGIADDLLTNTLLTARCPVVFFPAMHTEMWEHPAVVDNIATLRRRGVHIVEPGSGRLAGGDVGSGRLADPADIVAAVGSILAGGPLEGVTAVVTAGGTREPIDPVRFISNRSSGKMGFAVARAAREAGAEVVLVAGPVTIPTPSGVRRVDVENAEGMLAAVLRGVPQADIFISTAAVADYRPANPQDQKIKKTANTLDLNME